MTDRDHQNQEFCFPDLINQTVRRFPIGPQALEIGDQRLSETGVFLESFNHLSDSGPDIGR